MSQPESDHQRELDLFQVATSFARDQAQHVREILGKTWTWHRGWRSKATVSSMLDKALEALDMIARMDALREIARTGAWYPPRYWRALALHALADLDALGVPIDQIDGVDESILEQVREHAREQTAYS